MLFFYPMWDNESERIGKQKCTPAGYALDNVAQLLGFIALIILVGVIGYLIYTAVARAFDASLLWLIAIPFGVGMISEVLWQISWRMALRRGWQYDGDKREASWIENGQRQTYSWQDVQKERQQSDARH